MNIQRFFKGANVRALVVSNFFQNLIRLLTNLFIARVLSPEAFAVTGLATTILFAFNMIADGGFRAFILRDSRGDDVGFLSTLWTVRLLRNLVLCVLMYVFSPYIANFFGIQELSAVLKLLSIAFLLDGIRPISDYYVERKNEVAKVIYAKFFSYVFSTFFMVLGVALFKTYWAIIAGMLINSLCMIVIYYFYLGKIGMFFSFDKIIAIDFFKWSRYIVPSSIITLLLMQLDKVALGKILSVEKLGLYYVAFNFSSAVLTLIVQYSRAVMEPHMAVVYRDNRDSYGQVFYDFRIKLSMFLALMTGFLSGISFIFFDVLYDDRYIESSLYLSILLIPAVLALLSYPAELSLVVHGKVRMTLVANILRLSWFVLVGYLGYRYFGVNGFLISIALMDLLPIIYMFYRLNNLAILRLGRESLILLSAILGYGVGWFLTTIYRYNFGL